MATIIVGQRVGKNGRLGVGCSASIFDVSGEKVLLVRRADNGKWAVPGGSMQAGESFSEACKREVNIKRLIGIYTSPNLLLECSDGNKWQLIILHFEAEFISGELKPSEETIEFSFFSLSEMNGLEMNGLDRKRVSDGFARLQNAIINDDFVI